MADVNTTSTMAGFLKEVYGESVIALAPASVKLAKRFPFANAEMIGNKYHQPVDLTMEHGLTAAAAGAGTVTLLQPVAGQMQDAQVDGSQLFARSQVDYETLAKAANAGKAAFGDAVKHVVRRLTASGSKDLEIQLLHGQRGIGYVSAKSGSSTSRTFTIADASWSAAIWAGMENATLDIWKSDFSAKINSNAAIVVSAVDLDAKTVSVTGNSTDLTAVDTELASPTGGSYGPQIFRETHSPTTEMAGIDKIVRNTGTLFNISAATYSLWKGNVVSSTGQPTLAKILNGIARCVERGLEDSVIAVVSPRQFEAMNGDQAALRRYGAETSKAENGFEGLMFHCQTGYVEVMSHPYQKDGLIHILNPEDVKRIGAQDLTFFQKSGGRSDLIIRELPDKGASEMRAYSNQALFIEKPAQTAVLDGVTIA